MSNQWSQLDSNLGQPHSNPKPWPLSHTTSHTSIAAMESLHDCAFRHELSLSVNSCILIIYKMFHRTCSHIPCSLSFTNSLIWKFQASRTWKKEERKGSTLSFIKGEHASLFFSFALQMCKYIITGTTVYTIILNQCTTLLINFSVRMKFVKTILTFICY